MQSMVALQLNLSTIIPAHFAASPQSQRPKEDGRGRTGVFVLVVDFSLQPDRVFNWNSNPSLQLGAQCLNMTFDVLNFDLGVLGVFLEMTAVPTCTSIQEFQDHNAPAT
jgi:hypothetical protein